MSKLRVPPRWGKGRNQLVAAFASAFGKAARAAYSTMPGAWFEKLPLGTRPMTVAGLWDLKRAGEPVVELIYAHRGESR